MYVKYTSSFLRYLTMTDFWNASPGFVDVGISSQQLPGSILKESGRLFWEDEQGTPTVVIVSVGPCFGRLTDPAIAVTVGGYVIAKVQIVV